MLWFLVLSFLSLTFHHAKSMDCARSECLKLADPLVREARFIFPDNREDIQRGCRTWDEFVNCLKHYTEECFDEEDRRKFNNAVESPIENIHELCMNKKYQNGKKLNTPTHFAWKLTYRLWTDQIKLKFTYAT